MKWAPSPLGRTIIAFVAITLVCLIFSDIAVTTVEPWPEFRRLLAGLITPNFFGTEKLIQAILYTLSFALLGVVLANLFGLLLAVFFSSRIVRVGCAIVRSVHELFWALIFLQIFGDPRRVDPRRLGHPKPKVLKHDKYRAKTDAQFAHFFT